MRSLVNVLENTSITRFHYMLLLICSLIYALSAMNVMLIGVTLPSISNEWGLNQIAKGVLLSTGYVGMFIGAIGFGALADKIGRKTTLLITLAIAGIFTCLCSTAWNVTSLATLRFVAGIGLGGVLPLPGVYISEYIPADKRGRFTGLVETAWVYGVLLAIIFPFFIIPMYGWRVSFLASLLSISLLPFIVIYIPKSIRYLGSQGLYTDIKVILEKHFLLDKPLETIQITTEKQHSFFESLKILWSGQFLTRTVILWITWAVLVYTYHGIFQWLPTIYADITQAREVVGPLYWILIITLLQVPGYYSATFLLDRLGRKPVLILYLTIAGVASYMFSMSHGFQQIIFWSGVVSFFNLGAWAALYTYTPEQYPTTIRGTGSGSAASIGRMAGIAAPFLTGYIWSTWGLSWAFIVFAFVHIFNAVIIAILGIETKQRVLEEISKENHLN